MTDLSTRAEQAKPDEARGLTKDQRHILRHSLGLNYGRKMYRNHFVTGEGSTNYADCMALVEMGLMTRRAGNPITGGDDVFFVTDAGKKAARNKQEVK